MAEKIQVDLVDNTQAGAASVDANLEKVETAAEETAASLDNVADEAKQAGAAVQDIGKKSSGLKNVALRLTEINQGTELLKKGLHLVTSAVNTLADEGNPAFLSLQRSAADVRSELLRIAQSPEIQQFITGLADKIETELIPSLHSIGESAGPALNEVAEGFRSAQRWISNSTLALGEYVGAFDAAATTELKLTKELDDARSAAAAKQAEANRKAREVAESQKAIGAIDKKLGEESELRSIAEIQNAAELLALLDQERQAFIENATAGDKSGKTREESLKRIELIQRRLAEIPKQEADAYKKAIDDERKRQQDAADAALKEAESLAQQRLDIKVKFLEMEQQAEADAAQKRLDILKNEHEARVAMIEQADGGQLLQNAKQALDPRAIAQQVGNQRAAAARDQFTRENAGGLDASDANAVRRFNAQRNAAAAAAGRQGFRDVATGRASEQEIGQAQTSLIQASAQQAQAAGQLGASTAQALIQAANNQQQLAQQQAQQQGQIDAVRQALSGVGASVQNTRANAQRKGLGR